MDDELVALVHAMRKHMLRSNSGATAGCKVQIVDLGLSQHLNWLRQWN